MKRNFQQRFEKYMSKPNQDGCRLWLGGKYGSLKYGAFQIGVKKTGLAHRISYELYINKIPTGMYVMHICDNPPCVEPSHLKIGTHEDNMRDMAQKGRSNKGKIYGKRKQCKNS